ncbi:unnamed protein product [Phyllotreta striolata]|uniref:Uncharacterized protein n=1 Tax=Phyllotreta striolata TaxID=444603 RepID=A0A9N9TD88_PHYSR|nr:unnamed protein product [Phyllotreta striolata]
MLLEPGRINQRAALCRWNIAGYARRPFWTTAPQKSGLDRCRLTKTH